jgi:hypothetical protein
VAVTARLQAILEKPDRDLDLEELLFGFRVLRKSHETGTDGYKREDDIEHLKGALQAAVTLEFATLPPYLSALWSVKDDLSVVAKSLREIVQEEMLHMALACNLLVGIDGCPEINTVVPSYPGKLPLNVHPELTIHLSALNKAALTTFLEIERPNHPGHRLSMNAAQDLEADRVPEGSDDLTIGELYDQILESFKRNAPVLSTNRQITGPLAWMVMQNQDDVTKAIETISHQGEGSGGPVVAYLTGLAHYYRFAEIIELKQLVYDKETQQFAFVTPIPFDMVKDVWPMGPVPEGGFTDDLVPDPEVRRLLRGFNVTYSRLLDMLQAAWETEGGQAQLWHGIDTMFELEKFARPLMEIPRPDGNGNYGPDFRYLQPNAR